MDTTNDPRERLKRGRSKAEKKLLLSLLAWAGIVVVFGAVVLIIFAQLASSHWIKDPEFSLDSSQWYDVARSAIATMGLFGLGGAAFLAYRRQRTSEGNYELEKDRRKLEQKHHELEKDADFRGRYTQAAEQLGHERAAVRLAGVYAMAALADDWQAVENFRQQKVCVNILCAYLRMPYDPDLKGHIAAEREVRLSLIREITERLQPNATSSWSELDLDFSGVVFDGGNFSGAQFNGGRVSFEGAQFDGGRVSFEGAHFNSGRLSFEAAQFNDSTVSFFMAHFNTDSVVVFKGAHFNGCDVVFKRARFNKGSLVGFQGAQFNRGCRMGFVEAQFDGDMAFFDAQFNNGCAVAFAEMHFNKDSVVGFQGAQFNKGCRVIFKDVHFIAGCRALFKDVHFTAGCRVAFKGAYFDGGTVGFSGAHFDGGTVSFEDPSSWVKPPLTPWGNGPTPEGVEPSVWPPEVPKKTKFRPTM